MKKLKLVIIFSFTFFIILVILYFVFHRAPQIRLITPEDRSVFQEETADLSFIVDKSYLFTGIKNCTLYLGGEEYKKIENVPKNTTQTFHLDNLQNKKYDWKISCTDNLIILSKTAFTETRKFFVIHDPIQLLKPDQGEIFRERSVNLTFLLKEDYPFERLDSCDLYLNDSVFETKIDILRGTPQVYRLENLSNGVYKWKVSCTDKNNFISPETFFSKEEKEFNISVPSGENPDLTISNVNWIPYLPKVGDTLNFFVKVHNLGDDICSNAEVLVVDFNGWGNKNVIHNLRPNEEKEITVTLYVREIHTTNNPHDFRIEANCSPEKELNLGNNRTTRTINVFEASKELTIISPNGGEVWEIGKTYDIKWSSNEVDKVYIEYIYQSPGRGESGPIVSGIPASSGKYSWTIPSSFKTGNSYKILIRQSSTSYDFFDQSDDYFSIVLK
jgi:hypothetical protein